MAVSGIVRRTRGFIIACVIGATFVIIGSFFVATRLEENDAFCASCHSQPETEYFQRTRTNAVDLASAHANANAYAPMSDSGVQGGGAPPNKRARCIDCHSGPGVLGRVQSVGLGARDVLVWVSGQAEQPAAAQHPIQDANCLKCHIEITTKQGFDNHLHRHLARWQTQDADAAMCATCHSSHSTDGNSTIGFLNQQRALNQCAACHKSMGVDE
jgi:predicted CXXCH cytochrome family protein